MSADLTAQLLNTPSFQKAEFTTGSGMVKGKNMKCHKLGIQHHLARANVQIKGWKGGPGLTYLES